MDRSIIRRLSAALVVAGFVVPVVPLLPTAVSQAAAPIWTAVRPVEFPVQYEPVPRFESLSCAAPGECTALGLIEGEDELVAQTQSGGVWGEVVSIPMPAPGGFASDENISVSCVSAGDCTAAGMYFVIPSGDAGADEGDPPSYPFVATQTDGVWGESIDPTADLPPSPAENWELNKISCVADFCMGVGSIEFDGPEGTIQVPIALYTEAGTWVATGLEDIGELYDVVCSAPSQCSAVGSARVDGSGPEVGLVATFSAEVVQDGRLMGLSRLVEGLPNGLRHISCASVGNCVAYGVGSPDESPIVQQTDGEWGEPIEMDGRITSVSCAAAGACTVAGWKYREDYTLDMFIRSSSGGVWSAAVPVAFPAGATGSPQSGTIKAVSCAAVGECVAVGRFRTPSDSDAAFEVVQTAGVWGTAQPILEVGSVVPRVLELGLVECAAVGECTAVGYLILGEDGNFPIVQTLTGGAWGEPQTFVVESSLQNEEPDAQLYDVSCATAGNCDAIGFFYDADGNYQAFLASSVDGEWGSATPMPTVDGPASISTNFIPSVSCGEPGKCVAGFTRRVGDGTTWSAYVVSSPDGWWQPAAPISFPPEFSDGAYSDVKSVSCVSALDCVVGGSTPMIGSAMSVAYVASYVDGSWGDAQAVEMPAEFQGPDVSSDLYNVSCAAPGECTAIGRISQGGAYTAFTVSSVAGVWGVAEPVQFTEGTALSVRTVSCATPGNCTATGQFTIDGTVGTQGFTVSSVAGVWGIAKAVVFPVGTQQANPSVTPKELSCGAAGDCTVVGTFKNTASKNEAFTVSSVAGVWGQATPVVLPAEVRNAIPDNTLEAASCASAGNCTVGGYFKHVDGTRRAFTLTKVGGVWQEPAIATMDVENEQAREPRDRISSVSCPTANSCSVVGESRDENAFDQPFTMAMVNGEEREVPTPDVTSVSPSIVAVAGGTTLTITGTGFDTIASVTAKVGDVDCASVTVVSATEVRCVAAASATTGSLGVTVQNTENGASDTLANAVQRHSMLSWIAATFPPPSSVGAELGRDVKKIVDDRGNCNNDVSKTVRNLTKELKARSITQTQYDQALVMLTGICAQLNSGPAPSSLTSMSEVVSLDSSPVCSASFSSESVALNLIAPEVGVTSYSFDRTGFERSAVWVRVDGGAWSPAVGLDPANGSGASVAWSSEFMQLILALGGRAELSPYSSYNVELAFGTGGSFDAYDEASVVCTAQLSTRVDALLPETGSSATTTAWWALWISALGLLLVFGARRRAPLGC